MKKDTDKTTRLLDAVMNLVQKFERENKGISPSLVTSTLFTAYISREVFEDQDFDPERLLSEIKRKTIIAIGKYYQAFR